MGGYDFDWDSGSGEGLCVAAQAGFRTAGVVELLVLSLIWLVLGVSEARRTA